MSASASPGQTPKIKVLLILPFAIVAVLFVFFFGSLRGWFSLGSPGDLPSVLIGKPVPEFSLPGIANLQGDGGAVPGLSSAVFKTGEVSVLNFWSSTCAPCVIEHPQLAELAQLGIPLYSIDYKDKPEGARRFLTSHGNPYRAIGADESGMTAIDFGVTGTPETFVIDRQGRVVFRYQGPVTPEVLSAKIMPAIRKAERETAAPRS
jgi:cytochrome c biogenesis protein CcmG/thiol:disulfide interchange protein DsbE